MAMSRWLTEEQLAKHQAKMRGLDYAAISIRVGPTLMGKPASPLVVGLCKAHGINPPVAELEFHPLRKWKFDLAWINKIALEIEGGIWREGGGAHSRPANIIRDIEKYNAATLLGWRVLRCVPEKLSEGIANVALLLVNE
jgi:hypothetical protein